MGGYGSMNLALRHPDVFGDAAGIPVVLDVRQGGHDWDYVRTVLPAAFIFLAQGWRR